MTRTQDALQDKRKCSERSFESAPPEIRELHAAAKQAEGHVKKELQQQAKAKHNAWRIAAKRSGLAARIQQGKSNFKSQKLHEITAVIVPPNKTPEPDRNKWMPAVEKFFSEKWGCHDEQGLAKIEAMVQQCCQEGLTFDQDETVAAAEKMKKRLRMHRGGTCGEIFRLLAFNNEEYSKWLSRWAS